jgi:hypothetical protein
MPYSRSLCIPECLAAREARAREAKHIKNAKYRAEHLDELRDYNKRYTRENRARNAANKKAWRERNPDKVRAAHARQAAKRKQLDADALAQVRATINQRDRARRARERELPC